MEAEQKKILVTGASGGIGRAICLAAAKKGYYVIAHYNRGKEKAEETLRLVKEAGGEGELIQFDVSPLFSSNNQYFYSITYFLPSLITMPL